MISSIVNRLFSPKGYSPASARTSNNSNIFDEEDNDNNDDVSASSYYQKTVCLYDWWLVRADKDHQGKRLAVAGFTSTKPQAMRIFTSAPIVKRYSPFQLETSDGIYIIITRLINQSRTLENGFSSEVFSHINLGFHRDWEAHADKCFVKEVKAAADLEFAADAGTANCNSNSIPMDHENVMDKNKHNAGDVRISPEYLSEINPANASDSSDSPGRAADLNGIGNKKNCALKNPLLRNCDTMNVCSLEKNLAVPAEILVCHMPGSPERKANLRRRKGNTGTRSQLKTLERQKENEKSKDGLNNDNENSKLVFCGLKREGEMGSVSLLSDETRNIEENDNLCGELQEQSHSTLVRDRLKARGCKTISRAGTPRQKTNKFANSPCGPVDMNHDCNLKTAFDERERNVSSRKKAVRKINFDAHASPSTHERRENSSIVSPESLSLKRSRSGRLLVPSLDFWRNQIAVYDSGRKITGIQEGLDILKSPKEMKSQPPKMKRPKN